jgi:hypothetical protein
VQHRDPLVQVGRVERGDQVRGEHLGPAPLAGGDQVEDAHARSLSEQATYRLALAGGDPQVP